VTPDGNVTDEMADLKLCGIHHVSFRVVDNERSVNFCVDVLGGKQIPRPEMDFRGAWLRIGSQQVHLMESPGGAATSSNCNAIQVPDFRLNHVAFVVDDLDAARTYLTNRGIHVGEGPGP
jgi:catechol 2,3-dioxygenase-like lactoylglutathione lyase family enzyme